MNAKSGSPEPSPISDVNSDYPVMVTVDDGTHEGLVVGYDDYDDNVYYVVNPSSGDIETYNANEFTNCIAVTGYRVYE